MREWDYVTCGSCVHLLDQTLLEVQSLRKETNGLKTYKKDVVVFGVGGDIAAQNEPERHHENSKEKTIFSLAIVRSWQFPVVTSQHIINLNEITKTQKEKNFSSLAMVRPRYFPVLMIAQHIINLNDITKNKMKKKVFSFAMVRPWYFPVVISRKKKESVLRLFHRENKKQSDHLSTAAWQAMVYQLCERRKIRKCYWHSTSRNHDHFDFCLVFVIWKTVGNARALFFRCDKRN